MFGAVAAVVEPAVELGRTEPLLGGASKSNRHIAQLARFSGNLTKGYSPLSQLASHSSSVPLLLRLVEVSLVILPFPASKSLADGFADRRKKKNRCLRSGVLAVSGAVVEALVTAVGDLANVGAVAVGSVDVGGYVCVVSDAAVAFESFGGGVGLKKEIGSER